MPPHRSRPGDRPPRPREDFARYTRSGTVKIIIGAANTPNTDQTNTFHIYRDLLIAVSPYFRAKLEGRVALPAAAQPNHASNNGTRVPNSPMFVPREATITIDAEITSLHEPDFPLQPFTQFVNWVYNKPLSSLVKDQNLTTSTYLLAHTLQSERFRNDIVDAVRAYHATHAEAQLGLRCMVKLAKEMNPDDKENGGRNRLLEFLVSQMTYKVVTRGWEAGGFQGNGLVKQLFRTSVTVMIWHCDTLHEMLGQGGTVAAMQSLDRDRQVKIEGGEDGGDGEDTKVVGGQKGGEVKTRRPSLRLPSNPAEEGGCAWHEHKGKESRCGMAMIVD